MKIHSPVDERKARIEIIPLIDIMFFLLASFMAVSLSMVQMRGLGVNLPALTEAQAELSKDAVEVIVKKSGEMFVRDEAVEMQELMSRVQQLTRDRAGNEPPIYIRADLDASYGAVIRVLDALRDAGARKATFEGTARAVTAPAAANKSKERPSPTVSDPSGLEH